LIMDGRGRAREVIDLIDFEQQGLDHIVTGEFESRISHQFLYVLPTTGHKVIDADDVVAFFDQPATEVRPYETCSTSYEYSSHSCSILIKSDFGLPGYRQQILAHAAGFDLIKCKPLIRPLDAAVSNP
jgi:hypothetical protein